jgi:hypothetical protein
MLSSETTRAADIASYDEAMAIFQNSDYATAARPG